MTTFQVNVPEKPTFGQVIANCELALKIWRERVDPQKVLLHTWECGSSACFGGYVSRWPEFLELPGASGGFGEPDFNNEVGQLVMSAERAIFGCDWIFNARSPDERMDSKCDYDIVIDRLNRRIELARQGESEAT